MKERIFTLLLSLMFLIPSMAQEANDPGWSLNEETGELRIWRNYSNMVSPYNNAWLASKDLIKSVVIEDGVRMIADNAFRGCKDLTSVVIPNSVTSIGMSAFYECYSLTSVEIPNGVTCIYTETFSYCRALTSVVIPNSVTSIQSWAFWGCRSLTSIEIPNSVTSIGRQVFEECVNLTSVVIPNSLRNIESSAFSKCNRFRIVYTDKENPSILKPALGTAKAYILPCDFSDELVAKYTNAGMTAKKEWHNFTNYVYNEDASLDADGTETAVCDRDGCEATDTRVAEGTKLLPTGVEDVVAEKTKVVKTVENGRIVIIKDGKKYGVTGQILK